MLCGNEITAGEVLPGAVGDVCVFLSHTGSVKVECGRTSGRVAAQRRQIQTGGAMLQKLLLLHRLRLTFTPCWCWSSAPVFRYKPAVGWVHIGKFPLRDSKVLSVPPNSSHFWLERQLHVWRGTWVTFSWKMIFSKVTDELKKIKEQINRMYFFLFWFDLEKLVKQHQAKILQSQFCKWLYSG